MTVSRRSLGSAWFWGPVAAAAALLAGLGVARSPADTSRPTAFELEHGRILSFVGSFEGDVTLGRRKFVPTGGGGYGGYKRGYYTFEELGTARLALTTSDQRGGRLTISQASIGPSGYDGGGYGNGYKSEPRAADTDSMAAGRRGKAVVKYRRRRVKDEYGEFRFVESLDWTSAVRMKGGTKVQLRGTADLDYGTFAFDSRKSSVTGGATRQLAGGKTKALLSGFQVSSGGGLLHGDVTWTSEKSGKVAFTSPNFLEGKTGTIRALPGGRYQVKGPKGYPVTISFDDEGKGSVNLGLGKFGVVGGDYGGFAITFE